MNPQEIERTEFQTSFRGYDKPEVRNFLRRLARELVQLQSEMNPSGAEAGADDASSSSSSEAAVSVAVDAVPESADLIGTADLPKRPSFADAVSSTPGSTDDSSSSDPSVADSPSTAAGADLSSSTVPAGSSLADYVAPVVTREGVPSESVTPDAVTAPVAEVVEAEVAAPEVVEAEVISPDAVVAASAQNESDDERFQALGDRIAGLLKSAHESAASLSEMAEVEVSDKLAVAEAEADVIRAEAEAQAVEIREAALAEAEQLRTNAQLNLSEAEELKAKAVSDGRDELKVQREEVDELTNAAFEDRELAMAELTDARSQVTDLLGEARSQSDFLRHEAEEVIRARVRKNMEEAEERLNVLRNSEVASRARILAAREELEGAISRLDVEEAPTLPADPEHFALSGAQERADATNYGQNEAGYNTLDEDSVPVLDTPGSNDAAPVSTVETEVVETEVVEAEVVETPEVTGVAASDVDTSESEIIEVEVLAPPVTGDTSASATASTSDNDSLYTPPSVDPVGYTAPAVEALPVPEVDTSVAEVSEQLPQRGDTVPEAVVPEAVVPEAVVPEAVVPEAVVPEAVVPEAALPERPHEATQAPAAEAPAVKAEAADSSFRQDEDALGRLVRQAMERAVDSARSSD